MLTMSLDLRDYCKNQSKEIDPLVREILRRHSGEAHEN
jgi:hypothetical protein